MPPRQQTTAVACISLENWDDTWRRNQHFAAQLVSQGLADRLLFVEPPVPGARARRWSPTPGIDVLRPALWLPKRAGGLALAGALLRSRELRGIDVLWINDARFGRRCLTRSTRAVHDVTDDWRTFDNPARIRRRIVAAEDALATSCATVVCSQVLAERWAERYRVQAVVVHNGVDVDAFRTAQPQDLGPGGPHVGYVGTIHRERVDLELVLDLARSGLVGTVHLVGPLALDDADEQRLRSEPGVIVHGPVPSAQVPSWLVAMDVLLSPHVVSDFTLSLDAIKSYEYSMANRPVVATPTSGFQHLAHRVTVVERDGFLSAVQDAVGTVPDVHQDEGQDWAARAREFWACFGSAAGPP